MSLSIILVNYRSEQLIIDSLQSFLPESAIQPEVIVVDNSSGSPGPDRILQAFPQVKLIRMGYNAGFARANNAGIRQAAFDTVLLLNPDTLAPKQAIDRCYQALTRSAFIAGGVQLLNEDGSPQISGNYFMTGGLNHLLPLPYLGRLFKWMGGKLKVKKTHVPDSHEQVEVDWINGAFLMVKKEAIDRAGLLDEDFFLYAEEIEWCARLKKTGKLCIFGDIKLYHLQGETANEIFGSSGKGYYNLYDKKGLQIMVSNFLRIRKQYGPAWFLVHLFIYLLEIPLLWLGFFVQKLAGKPSFTLKMVSGYCKNMVTLLRLSVRMLAARPYFYKML